MTDEKDLLEEALDHVDNAVYLLRRLAREKPDRAEELEDAIMILEEAGELIEKLLRSLSS